MIQKQCTSNQQKELRIKPKQTKLKNKLILANYYRTFMPSERLQTVTCNYIPHLYTIIPRSRYNILAISRYYYALNLLNYIIIFLILCNINCFSMFIERLHKFFRLRVNFLLEVHYLLFINLLFIVLNLNLNLN